MNRREWRIDRIQARHPPCLNQTLDPRATDTSCHANNSTGECQDSKRARLGHGSNRKANSASRWNGLIERITKGVVRIEQRNRVISGRQSRSIKIEREPAIRRREIIYRLTQVGKDLIHAKARIRLLNNCRDIQVASSKVPRCPCRTGCADSSSRIVGCPAASGAERPFDEPSLDIERSHNSRH